MPPAHRPTLADIARATGLSVSAVSMALRERPGSRIPPETIARVKAAAADLGYVTNAQARGLRTGRTATLGFVSDEVTVTRFAAGMLRGLLDATEEREHALMIAEADHRPDRFARAFDSMRSHRIDALAVGLMDSRHVTLPAATSREPRVVINGTADGCHAVLPDEHPAGRAAVEHLLHRGHRRIALVGRHPHRAAPEVSVNIPIRLDGIDAAMDDAGLRFAAEHRGTVWEPELGREGVAAVLEQASDVTAILAVNDRVAFGVLQGLQERGLRVPEDVSVLSFDDEELASLVRPGLTTLRLPYPEMGAIGAGLLLDALATGEAPAPGTTLVPLELVERGSVRSV